MAQHAFQLGCWYSPPVPKNPERSGNSDPLVETRLQGGLNTIHPEAKAYRLLLRPVTFLRMELKAFSGP